jgi:hypothetical protein
MGQRGHDFLEVGWPVAHKIGLEAMGLSPTPGPGWPIPILKQTEQSDLNSASHRSLPSSLLAPPLRACSLFPAPRYPAAADPLVHAPSLPPYLHPARTTWKGAAPPLPVWLPCALLLELYNFYSEAMLDKDWCWFVLRSFIQCIRLIDICTLVLCWCCISPVRFFFFSFWTTAAALPFYLDRKKEENNFDCFLQEILI